MIGDKDQERRRKMLFNAMINSDYSFIRLRLLDLRKNRIQGAYYLHGTPFEDQATGVMNYHFEKRGGPLVFEEDEATGGMYHMMLDCDENRRFLASMSAYRFWKIEDKQIESEILEMAAEMTKKAIRKQPPPPPEKVMSDEELERESLKIQQEMTKRKLAKTAPITIPKPVEEPKPEEARIVPVETEVTTQDDFIQVAEMQGEAIESQTKPRRARRKVKQPETVGG